MPTRTTFETVTFAAPFAFRSLDEILPAGDYTIETDSERLEGVSFPAWRRLMTLIHLPVKTIGTSRLLAIDPKELEILLARDRKGLPSTQSAQPDLSASSNSAAFDDNGVPPADLA